MTFVVDCMLGKLAKWLKILGFDTLFFPKAEDDDLLDIARREGRTLLSRDTAMLQRAKGVPHLFIESEVWEDQIRQVLARFDLYDKIEPYSRCLECNVRLKPISREAAAKLVAPFVLESAPSFSVCPRCGRVYWPGSHYDDMADRLAELTRRPDQRDRNGV